MPTITPHLWFEKDAQEAAEFYCSVFPDSRVIDTQHIENTGPNLDMNVAIVTFEVCGQRVIALEAGPEFQFNEAFSFYVECEDQAEVDDYWSKLTGNGGEEGPCGWLKDRYGLSWQIIPKLLTELMQDEDQARADSVMRAMLQMKKIDCDVLRQAYNEPAGANA